jgi:hypothetical protein
LEISIARDVASTGDEELMVLAFTGGAASFSLALTGIDLAKSYQRSGETKKAEKEISESRDNFRAAKGKLELAETYYTNGKIYK